MEFSKIALAISSLCLLNGCLKVEDNNNDELVAALQEQNQILQEQQQQQNTVAIHGIVIDGFDGAIKPNALVTVKIGSETVASNIQTTNGEFEVKKLPANSDVEIIVSSENDEFLTRVFFYNTGSSTSGEAKKDFGSFAVSEGVEVEISVLDSETNAPLDNLAFKGNSNFGTGSSQTEYLHTSSFDEVNGVYHITIPKYIEVNLYASIDFDKDGESDYLPERPQYNGGNYLHLSWNDAKKNPTIYVSAVGSETTPIEFRVTVVDSLGNALEGAEVVFTTYDDNEKLTASYDSESTQYLLNANFEDNGIIQIPAFTANGVDYQSSSIEISSLSDEMLYINQNASNYSSYYLPLNSVIDLAIQPRISTSDISDLKVVFKSDINPSDSGFSVFYSQPVNVTNDNITLYSNSLVTVTRGNDDANDLVLPGVTVLTTGKNIPVTSSQSLNKTKLSIKPAETLIGGLNYTYTVGTIELDSTKSKVDVSGDQNSFVATFDMSQAFDINDLSLDNNNYTTNGAPIKATNTAGESSSASNRNNNVYIIFPDSVRNLQNFTLRQMIVKDDGISRSDTNFFNVVSDGQLNSISRFFAVSVAPNEVVEEHGAGYVNRISGLNLSTDQFIYAQNLYEYMSDNLSGSENSVTFEYAYETKKGDVVTGTITLPVN